MAVGMRHGARARPAAHRDAAHLRNAGRYWTARQVTSVWRFESSREKLEDRKACLGVRCVVPDKEGHYLFGAILGQFPLGKHRQERCAVTEAASCFDEQSAGGLIRHMTFFSGPVSGRKTHQCEDKGSGANEAFPNEHCRLSSRNSAFL